MQLLSTQAHVESPFIILKIGKWTFGQYRKDTVDKNIYGAQTSVTYPTMMKSLTVEKINGTVNTYTIEMEYGVSAGDDPNLLEKVFGSISDTREITISYGDWNQPAFIFKEETALVTKITSRVDFTSSKLNYTITAISNSVSLKSTLWNFGARTEKPSSVIFEILNNKSYGLQSVFTGMKSIDAVRKADLIDTDDKKVKIEAKYGINILDYLSYLVSCMVCQTNTDVAKVNDSVYHFAIYDDISKELSGTYFKVKKIPACITNVVDSHEVYEVDVGYPTDNYVTSFELKSDSTWSLLYHYAMENQNNYTYEVDEKGQVAYDKLPKIFQNMGKTYVNETKKNWWTEVTQFPIGATIVVKGLLRPAMLMSYIRVNSYFYGQKYIASGLYIITKQVDRVDSAGYKTTLSLQRIGADDESLSNYEAFSNKYLGTNGRTIK